MYKCIVSFLFSILVSNAFAESICCTDSLEVKHLDSKGRGVFAKRFFEKGELVERVPMLPLSQQEEPFEKSLVLYNYVFGWGPDLKYSAVALGYGSIYNHSYKPNAVYIRHEEQLVMDIIALEQITRGEEILINYNGDPKSQKPVWFDAK